MPAILNLKAFLQEHTVCLDKPALHVSGIDVANSAGVLQRLGTALIPNLRVETFTNCGHFTQLEQPSHYCALLKDFLR